MNDSISVKTFSIIFWNTHPKRCNYNTEYIQIIEYECNKEIINNYFWLSVVTGECFFFQLISPFNIYNIVYE